MYTFLILVVPPPASTSSFHLLAYRSFIAESTTERGEGVVSLPGDSHLQLLITCIPQKKTGRTWYCT